MHLHFANCLLVLSGIVNVSRSAQLRVPGALHASSFGALKSCVQVVCDATCVERDTPNQSVFKKTERLGRFSLDVWKALASIWSVGKNLKMWCDDHVYAAYKNTRVRTVYLKKCDVLFTLA
jgi:hypothetical protein